MASFSRDAYSANQIEAMERIMLQSCKWLVNPPTALSFGHHLTQWVTSVEKRYPLEALLELTNLQVEAALHDYVLCSAVSPSLVAISAVMNAIEGMELTSEEEQQTLLHHICSTLNVSHNDEFDFDLIQRVQIRLYEGLTGTYCTEIHSSSSSSTNRGPNSETEMEVSPFSICRDAAAAIRPTSPKSVLVSAGVPENCDNPSRRRFHHHRFSDEMDL
jgi:hypothetical protein